MTSTCVPRRVERRRVRHVLTRDGLWYAPDPAARPPRAPCRRRRHTRATALDRAAAERAAGGDPRELEHHLRQHAVRERDAGSSIGIGGSACISIASLSTAIAPSRADVDARGAAALVRRLARPVRLVLPARAAERHELPRRAVREKVLQASTFSTSAECAAQPLSGGSGAERRVGSKHLAMARS